MFGIKILLPSTRKFHLVLNPSEHFLTKNPYDHVKQKQANSLINVDIAHYVSQY